MFNLLRRSRQPKERTPTTSSATVGGGLRVYAIGDVHGRRDLLADLLQIIAADHRDRGPVRDFRLIFLGDLIDRGPDSAGVVDLVMEVAESWPGTECLMGNHEEVLLMALRGNVRAIDLFRNLGLETLLSYGIDVDLIAHGEATDLQAAMLRQIPEAHRDYLANRPDWMVLGDYCFVHAGIRPGIPIEEQSGRDMRWIRRPFLKSGASHSHVIVHGHSISDTEDVQKNRIGIDTGAYVTERLTAVGLEAKDRWFLST